MCKRMKINNLHVVARPFYRIDNLDGVFSLPFPREWIAGPGKASQRGRTAPRFPDRWILPTMCRSPPPPPPLCIRGLHRGFALWVHQTSVRPSRTSVRSTSHSLSLTTYSLTLGSLPSTSSSTLLSFFSLAHLLRLLARYETSNSPELLPRERERKGLVVFTLLFRSYPSPLPDSGKANLSQK